MNDKIINKSTNCKSVDKVNELPKNNELNDEAMEKIGGGKNLWPLIPEMIGEE